MRYLVDEDVDIAVGGHLAFLGCDVDYVVQVLGSGTKDPVIRRLLRSKLRVGDTVLVTADKEFAGRAGQPGSRLPCLWLRDLVELEYDRTVLLADVILREAEIAEGRFFMEIRRASFVVKR